MKPSLSGLGARTVDDAGLEGRWALSATPWPSWAAANPAEGARCGHRVAVQRLPTTATTAMRASRSRPVAVDQPDSDRRGAPGHAPPTRGLLRTLAPPSHTPMGAVTGVRRCVAQSQLRATVRDQGGRRRKAVAVRRPGVSHRGLRRVTRISRPRRPSGPEMAADGARLGLAAPPGVRRGQAEAPSGSPSRIGAWLEVPRARAGRSRALSVSSSQRLVDPTLHGNGGVGRSGQLPTAYPVTPGARSLSNLEGEHGNRPGHASTHPLCCPPMKSGSGSRISYLRRGWVRRLRRER